MLETPRKTVRVCYTGRVQGVGFRYTVCEIVRGHPVDGYVKNLADGRVELLLQGTTGQIEPLLQAIADRFQGNIAGEDRRILRSSERFQWFEVRH